MRNLVVMYDSNVSLLAKFDVISRYRHRGLCSVAYQIQNKVTIYDKFGQQYNNNDNDIDNDNNNNNNKGLGFRKALYLYMCTGFAPCPTQTRVCICPISAILVKFS